MVRCLWSAHAHVFVAACPRGSFCPAASVSPTPCSARPAHTTSPESSTSASACVCESGFIPAGGRCLAWANVTSTQLSLWKFDGEHFAHASAVLTVLFSGQSYSNMTIRLDASQFATVTSHLSIPAGSTAFNVTLRGLAETPNNAPIPLRFTLSSADLSFDALTIPTVSVAVFPVSGCNLDAKPCAQRGVCDPWNGVCNCKVEGYVNPGCQECAPGMRHFAVTLASSWSQVL